MIFQKPQEILQLLFELRGMSIENMCNSGKCLRDGNYSNNIEDQKLMYYFYDNIFTERAFLNWIDSKIIRFQEIEKKRKSENDHASSSINDFYP